MNRGVVVMTEVKDDEQRALLFRVKNGQEDEGIIPSSTSHSQGGQMSAVPENSSTTGLRSPAGSLSSPVKHWSFCSSETKGEKCESSFRAEHSRTGKQAGHELSCTLIMGEYMSQYPP